MKIAVISELSFFGRTTIMNTLEGKDLRISSFCGMSLSAEGLADELRELQPEFIIFESNGRLDVESIIIWLNKVGNQSPLIMLSYLEGAYREALEFRKKTFWVQRTDDLTEDAAEIIKLMEKIKEE